MTKEEAQTYIGKRVMVRSHRVTDKTGVVKSYKSHGHHFWVYLDEPIKNRGNGKLSNWHKCNAGNCTLLTEKDK
jgi:flagellar hook assembly protein FlgD